MKSLLQTIIGLTVMEATQLEDTQSTYFEFAKGLSCIWQYENISRGTDLENIVGDEIKSFSDDDPSAVTIEFKSNSKIIFDVVEAEDLFSPERICYRNLNTNPPIYDLIKQIDDFYRS